MKIKLYAPCWNEEKMLPYFFSHYNSIVDEYVIFDNYSTDDSCNIIASNPKATIELFNSNNEYNEPILIDLKRNCWKKDTSPDWVIVCDIDELIYAKDLRAKLEELKKQEFTIVKSTGYEMVSRHFNFGPGQIYDYLQEGAPSIDYSKTILFNPKAIRDTLWNPGCHTGRFTGNIQLYRDPSIALLHYKFIDEQYLKDRFKAVGERMAKVCLDNGWGMYRWPKEKIEGIYKDLEARKGNVIQSMEHL